MADQKINELPTKTAPSTGDKMLMIGAAEEYQIDYDKLASAILDKLATKQYSELDTTAKTVLGALDELNSKTISKIPFVMIDYLESNKEESMNKLNNPTTLFGNIYTPYCILFKDSVGDSIFSGGITAIYGYAYMGDQYGSQLCMKYGMTLRYRTKAVGTWTNLKDIQMID